MSEVDAQRVMDAASKTLGKIEDLLAGDDKVPPHVLARIPESLAKIATLVDSQRVDETLDTGSILDTLDKLPASAQRRMLDSEIERVEAEYQELVRRREELNQEGEDDGEKQV